MVFLNVDSKYYRKNNSTWEMQKIIHSTMYLSQWEIMVKFKENIPKCVKSVANIFYCLGKHPPSKWLPQRQTKIIWEWISCNETILIPEIVT